MLRWMETTHHVPKRQPDGEMPGSGKFGGGGGQLREGMLKLDALKNASGDT